MITRQVDYTEEIFSFKILLKSQQLFASRKHCQQKELIQVASGKGHHVTSRHGVAHEVKCKQWHMKENVNNGT